MKKSLSGAGCFLLLWLAAASPLAADTVIVREDVDDVDVVSAWEVPDTPIGEFFYLLGDVVSLPFDFVGNLF